MSAGVLLVYLPPVVVVGVLAAVVIHLSVLEIGLLMLLAGTVWLTSASIGTSSRPRSATTGRSGPTRAFSSTSSECFRRCSIRSACSRHTSAPVALLMPPSAAAALVQWVIGVTALTRPEVYLASGGLAVEGVGLFLFAVYWARRTVREN